MERLSRHLAFGIAVLTALAAAALAWGADVPPPHHGDYQGRATPSGHQVHFHVDLADYKVKDFYLGGIKIFDHATLSHGTFSKSEEWRFDHIDSTYRVHGVWGSSGTYVFGAINKHSGVVTGRQSYSAHHVPTLFRR